jgi:hypothetical protein
MYRLTTRDGDIWEFDDLEETRKNQYISCPPKRRILLSFWVF